MLPDRRPFQRGAANTHGVFKTPLRATPVGTRAWKTPRNPGFAARVPAAVLLCWWGCPGRTCWLGRCCRMLHSSVQPPTSSPASTAIRNNHLLMTNSQEAPLENAGSPSFQVHEMLPRDHQTTRGWYQPQLLEMSKHLRASFSAATKTHLFSTHTQARSQPETF